MSGEASNTRKETGRFYKLHLIWYRIRHGMILLSIRNLLLRLKININPYWIDREGLDLSAEPRLPEPPETYRLEAVPRKQLRPLFELLRYNLDMLEDRPESPYEALGLYKGEELAAFTMMRYGQFELSGKKFLLSPGEAYLENMYTFENFRGKKLAPYLRYQCYKYLEGKGISRCYSGTQCLNTASRRFKAKLNIQHETLYLHIDLFKRFRRTYLLRRYTPSAPPAN
ncbi:GNAT family N-acetyltransferase [Robiginitalea biformata]|uniref:GNAT family N-acetyltransferase n=1 Tax=Robiginitalea biformata TaxID=252307 RepID=UPI003B5B1BD0